MSSPIAVSVAPSHWLKWLQRAIGGASIVAEATSMVGGTLLAPCARLTAGWYGLWGGVALGAIAVALPLASRFLSPRPPYSRAGVAMGLIGLALAVPAFGWFVIVALGTHCVR